VLFTSSFQATLSAGALVGGLLLDRTTVSVVMVAGGLTALLMVGMLALESVTQNTGGGRDVASRL
jgi:predicted MFS family arabinose efflux permease